MGGLATTQGGEMTPRRGVGMSTGVQATSQARSRERDNPIAAAIEASGWTHDDIMLAIAGFNAALTIAILLGVISS